MEFDQWRRLLANAVFSPARPGPEPIVRYKCELPCLSAGMHHHRADLVPPSAVITAHGGTEGFLYACLTTPHNAALWQPLSGDSRPPVYSNRGHYHLGSQTLLMQPLGDPSRASERLTSGLPKPLTQTAVIARTPHALILLHMGLRDGMQANTTPCLDSPPVKLPVTESKPRLSSATVSPPPAASMARRAGAQQESLPPIAAASADGEADRQASGTTSPLPAVVEEGVEQDDGPVLPDVGAMDLEPRVANKRQGSGQVRAVEAGGGSVLPLVLVQTLQPTIEAGKAPGYARPEAEKHVRRARKVPPPGLAEPLVTSEPFARPYRARLDGERVRLPSRTEMIHRVLHAQDSPRVSNSRSLYHYDPLRHTIGSIRDLNQPRDRYAPRWR
ncbi:uncharacterized protein MONBRDRAFT_25308 [Monosiga brevicollis MX1]|uniref:Uncharacterized protein n=1 Tax=Monosiga brevicollis TaxID=81824 RepID=A9UZ14_MONBE|nr:uncharacterized protein MONBRDRAFT_25308 [Monosiga brevicollis MX1]EDQ89705.1 predicted protein [Monosiga brevicollis MX1]|eukprot:XP_001745734.1 hypothetical protein [Monosiga brevicollis MX1]